MTMTKSAAFGKMMTVRRELDSAQFALQYTIRMVLNDVGTLQEAGRGGTSRAELERCRDKLEINYILRLFSEFEAALRNYWVVSVRDTRPNMEVLMDRVADRVHMTAGPRSDAHAIREYRNNIVHQVPGALAHTYGDCARALGRYLDWLPQGW